MKGLTIYQPWANLIADGIKTIETRSWATTYRGELLIHAGKSTKFWEGDDDMSYGAILAVVDLVTIVPAVDALDLHPDQCLYGDFSPGRWAWMLRNVRKVDPPLPVRGRRGLWTPDHADEEDIRAHITR